MSLNKLVTNPTYVRDSNLVNDGLVALQGGKHEEDNNGRLRTLKEYPSHPRDREVRRFCSIPQSNLAQVIKCFDFERRIENAKKLLAGYKIDESKTRDILHKLHIGYDC